MTDDELNAAIAAEVMGWKLKATRNRPMGSGYTSWVDSNGRERIRTNAWSPTTDIADAFEVVERMGRKGHIWTLTIWTSRAIATLSDGPTATAQTLNTSLPRASMPVPRAICEAALRAVRS